ncbi:MAG: type I secretion protein TolC, partial [Epsilonproteobacteria bacterium]|nr:type I secretion protein TolC [Campylobacterota bacterium]
TSEGEENLDNLIRQLTTLDISKMRFDLLSNIDNPSLTEEIRNTLCNERALLIKDRLVAAGALEEAISFRSYSDKAPLFTNESSYGTAQNNRVDIIVKKYKN